jgi:tetratricopeptide (TPR) repeat protein
MADLEIALEVARSSGALATVARLHNDLAVGHQMLGDLERGYAARLEGARAAHRLGAESLVRWYDGVLTEHRYARGDWDSALRAADELLARVEAGEPHLITWQVHAVRAEIRLARDDAAGALADAERALEDGRAVAEIQAVAYVLIASAHVFSLTGEEERARELIREHAAMLRAGTRIQFAVIRLPFLASAASRLGLAREAADTVASCPSSRWTAAATAYLSGDFPSAADILAKAGARHQEAEARVRAAESLAQEGRTSEAEAQLERALEFHRSVGATRYLREADAVRARLAGAAGD